MITYINPDAIEDQSIDWSKLKNIPDFPSGGESGNSIPPMVNVTYLEIKDLRDNVELVPGQQYRITDYVTTTAQANTKSAGHPFDIIVTADDEYTLNEKARAIQHEGDTYFANQNLSAWELWYCLDNDTDRFAWANNTSGESIIDTIKPASGVSASGTYTYDTPISKVIYNGTTYNLEIGVRTMINSGPPIYITKTDSYTLVAEELSAGYIAAGSGISVYGNISQVGKGIIYRMIDKYGNDCPYDFKNIMFRHPKDTTTYPDYYYTFTCLNNGAVSDYSLNDNFCRNNTIKKYGVDNGGAIEYELNNIVFINTSNTSNCHGNSFGNDCYNNSFGHDCYNNSFGHDCYNNSFGNSCTKNSFGKDCHDNSFGFNCDHNSFGDNCAENTFVNSCYNNNFGNSCGINTFEGGCHNNSFGSSCVNNSFGTGCYNNSFGILCSENSFGNQCRENSFGSSCFDNHFGSSCYQNTLGNGLSSTTFGDAITNRAYFKGKVYASGGFYEE